MKNSNKMKALVAALVLAGFATTANAQISATEATATAAATILQPITIVKTGGANTMNFGTIGADATLAKTVILATDGTRTGTATRYTVGAPAAAGSYLITGTANATFDVTLPTTVTIDGGVPTAGAQMTITNWVSNHSSFPAIDATGNRTLLVGATLNVGAGQLPGLYTSAPFSVTVAYN